MTAPARTTVLIVDDDQYNRRGIGDIFAATADIVVVGEIDDGEHAVREVTRLRPHVVLMDLKMRRVGGLEATRELMAMPSPPKVIAMTAMDVDDLVVQSLAAGAVSFLSKDEPPATFQQSVRVVAGGNTMFSPAALAQIVASGHVPQPPARPLRTPLSPRELEVLAGVARGWSNAQICAELYLAETTVKTHVSSIFTKLGVNNRVLAVIAAVHAGLAHI